MKLLENLKQAFVPYDEIFQKAKTENAKLAKETDSWLFAMRAILEESVMKSL